MPTNFTIVNNIGALNALNRLQRAGAMLKLKR